MNLNLQEQIRFLAMLANRLTICGRDAYLEANVSASVEQQCAQLRAVNEIQHTVLSQLQSMVNDVATRYPDDVFCDIVEEAGDSIHGYKWAVGVAQERLG